MPEQADTQTTNVRPLAAPPSSAARARDLWREAVDKEVKIRLDDYFNEEWMIMRVSRMAVPDGAKLAECYETEKEWVIMGTVDPDDEEHNCDALGCGTLSHVVDRVRKRNT